MDNGHGYFPLGSYDDPRAPWNERKEEKEYVDFPCEVTYVMSRDSEITTADYDEETHEIYTTSDRTLEDFYEEKHRSISELLDELVFFAERELSCVNENTGRGIYLKGLIRECKGWKTDATNVELK